MGHRIATELNRLLSSLRWHSDRLAEESSCGHAYHFKHHREAITELCIRIRAIDSSRETNDIVRELLS
jgi:hypothetical protein